MNPQRIGRGFALIHAEHRERPAPHCLAQHRKDVGIRMALRANWRKIVGIFSQALGQIAPAPPAAACGSSAYLSLLPDWMLNNPHTASVPDLCRPT